MEALHTSEQTKQEGLMCSMSVNYITQKALITNKCTKRVSSSIVTHSYMFRPCWVIFRENFFVILTLRLTLDCVLRCFWRRELSAVRACRPGPQRVRSCSGSILCAVLSYPCSLKRRRCQNLSQRAETFSLKHIHIYHLSSEHSRIKMSQ
jgi:hypothetical protein